MNISPSLTRKFAVFNRRGGYSSAEIDTDVKLKSKQWDLFTKIWLRKGKAFLEDLQ